VDCSRPGLTQCVAHRQTSTFDVRMRYMDTAFAISELSSLPGICRVHPPGTAFASFETMFRMNTQKVHSEASCRYEHHKRSVPDLRALSFKRCLWSCWLSEGHERAAVPNLSGMWQIHQLDLLARDLLSESLWRFDEPGRKDMTARLLKVA
jgi:hypothetical protein